MDIKYKYTFVGTILIGLLAHGMALFNEFSIHDNLGCLFNKGASYGSGRWMIGLITKFNSLLFGTSEYSLPLINGLLSILMIAIGSCLLVLFMNIRRLRYCLLLGGLLVVFPTIATLFGYMFTADLYMLSFCLAIAGSVLLCYSSKRGIWLISIMLLTASLGIYQAFLPIILTIFLFHLIKLCTEQKFERGKLGKELTKLAVSSILFLFLYAILVKFFLVITHSEMLSYKGADSVSFSPVEYLKRIPLAYRTFFIPGGNEDSFFLYGSLDCFYYLLLFVTIVLSVLLVLKRMSDSRASGLFLAVFMMLLPMCINFMYVMCNEDYITSLLQMYGFIMLFVYDIWLMEVFCSDTNKKHKAVSTINQVLLLIILILFIRLDNICYLKASYTQQQAICYYTTLISKIKSLEGYKDTMPVAFVGLYGIEDCTVKEIPEFDLIKIAPYCGLSEYINNYTALDFMHYWCGYCPEFVDAKIFEKNQMVVDMPSYPNDGSVKILDNTIVVKLGKPNRKYMD